MGPVSELEWYELDGFKTQSEELYEMGAKRRGFQKGDLLKYKCRGKVPADMERFSNVCVYMGKEIKKDQRGVKYINHYLQVGTERVTIDGTFIGSMTRIAKGG
tara:strand:+ start:1543 stop:1851 length:309 start_codon:yes stop_codon:yes gene_type:complete